MRQTIGITAGDPAGIGLETIFKALPRILPEARWVLFTDRATFEQNYSAFGSGLRFRWIQRLDEISDDAVLFTYDVHPDACPIAWGDVDPQAGRRALGYLEAASRAANSGSIEAIVTAPVSKEAIGGTFVGQTDLLAERAGVNRFA